MEFYRKLGATLFLVAFIVQFCYFFANVTSKQERSIAECDSEGGAYFQRESLCLDIKRIRLSTDK